jgi:NADH-quinone oxidoreductase subunit J
MVAVAEIDPTLIPTEAWPLVAAAAFAMAAIFMFLPRPRPWPFARLAGAAATGLAFAGVVLIAGRAVRFTAETVLFYAFAALALISGGVMITRANPARAALSFALVVLSTTGLFLLQAAPFLMAGTVIVYAGAIVVTFLFVIMLAQPGGASDADRRSREPLLATIAGFFLLATLLLVLRQTYTTGEINALLMRVNEARQKSTTEEIRAALGDRDEFVARLERQVERAPTGTPAADAIRAETDSAGAAWSAPSADLARKRLDSLAIALANARAQIGRLRPAAGLKLSPLSGSPANHTPAGLSSENVAGLGRTLFSDDLLAVEIAGTLLLVAAIGAIAIAHRPVASRRAA